MKAIPRSKLTMLLLCICKPLNYYTTFHVLPCVRKGWFSNTSFTTGLKTLPTFRPDALVFFALKKTRASGRNIGKVFNPVVKLVLENQPFLMPEPAEKPSLHSSLCCLCRASTFDAIQWNLYWTKNKGVGAIESRFLFDSSYP